MPPGFMVILRKNGVKVGEVGPYKDEKSAKDDAAVIKIRLKIHGTGVSVEPITFEQYGFTDTYERASERGSRYIKMAAGGVIINDEGLVLLREPKNHYMGYVWTHAKGQADKGETAEQTAVREVREETGYETEIVAPLVLPQKQSDVRYFLLRPVAKVAEPHWETHQVRWFTPDEAVARIGETGVEGAQRDYDVLVLAVQAWRKAHGLPPWAPPPLPPPPPKPKHEAPAWHGGQGHLPGMEEQIPGVTIKGSSYHGSTSYKPKHKPAKEWDDPFDTSTPEEDEGWAAPPSTPPPKPATPPAQPPPSTASPTGMWIGGKFVPYDKKKE